MEGQAPSALGDADDRGRFALPCPDGKVVIYARSPDGRFAGYALFDRKDGRGPTIVAVPAASARGRVLDSNGKPWASVNVVYYAEVGPPGA